VDDILERVATLVEQFAPLRPETRPRADTVLLDGGLDFDSVALLELVTELEEELGCEIPSEAFSSGSLRTVGDLASLLSDGLAPAAASAAR
jgi:acyl carrier protein